MSAALLSGVFEGHLPLLNNKSVSRTARESGGASPDLHGAKFTSTGRLGRPLDMRGGEALLK